jgi:hypothetical protein
MAKRWIALAALLLGGLALPAAALAAAAPPPPPVDQDTGARAGTDTTWVLRDLDPPGHYELAVYNTTAIGYINQFRWTPGPGTNITVISKVVGGTCSIDNGSLECKGKIAPPICTCLPGGSLTVDFYATGPSPAANMYLALETITPVPWHIPSFLSPLQALELDLPTCKPATPASPGHKATKAQVSSALHPCQKAAT